MDQNELELKLFLWTLTSSYHIFLACSHCLVVVGDKVTYIDPSAADPGEGHGWPSPLCLDQTEAQRAQKNFFETTLPPLSEGLDPPLPLPTGKVSLKCYLPSKKIYCLVPNTQMRLLSSLSKVLSG